jgi:hypothetical protein
MRFARVYVRERGNKFLETQDTRGCQRLDEEILRLMTPPHALIRVEENSFHEFMMQS